MKRINLKNSFLRSLTVLASGSLIAQGVLAFSQIVFAKIFTPEALGIYAFLLSLPTAFVGVICGRYDLPLVYEEDEKKVYPLIKLNVLINLIFSTVIMIVDAIYLYFFKPDYARFLWMLPAIWVFLVAYGLTNTLNSYNNRYRDYKMITKMYVARTLAQCLGSVFLGLIFVTLLKNKGEMLSVALLMIPHCLGMLFGVFTQGKGMLQHKNEIIHASKKELLAVAKKHIKQPILSGPAIFANSFSYSLMTMIVEGFGKACAGYYSISNKLLGMPISLISGNISKVYMEEASKEYNKTGKFKKAFNRTFLFLIALAIPMFLCMYFLAPPVCAWLFGGDWIEAGRYIKILSLMFTVRFVITALSPGLYACRKQQLELILQGMLLVVTIIAGAVSSAMSYRIEDFLLLVGVLRSAVMLCHIMVVFVCSRGWKSIRLKELSGEPAQAAGDDSDSSASDR